MTKGLTLMVELSKQEVQLHRYGRFLDAWNRCQSRLVWFPCDPSDGQPSTFGTWMCDIKEIQAQLYSTRRERKRSAIQNSRELMGELPSISRKAIGSFHRRSPRKCPTISDRDLSRTVEILAKLEQSRAGYDLLAQLAACSSDDLDTWNNLMQQWTASNAEIVLDELDRRLKLIVRMENAGRENPHADELHDLQPLFERGLWIFGPEYEAVDFRSNRGLTEIIGKFLGGPEYKPPKKRPDFVVLRIRQLVHTARTRTTRRVRYLGFVKWHC